MKIDRFVKSLVFRGEDHEHLRIYYDNRGDPYREGITFILEDDDFRISVGVFLENNEIKNLRDFLNKVYPE